METLKNWIIWGDLGSNTTCMSVRFFFCFGSFKLATTCLFACVACQSICRLSCVHSWKEWTFFLGGGKHLCTCKCLFCQYTRYNSLLLFLLRIICSLCQYCIQLLKYQTCLLFFGHQGRLLCSPDFHVSTPGESLGNVIERCACEHLSGGGVG